MNKRTPIEFYVEKISNVKQVSSQEEKHCVEAIRAEIVDDRGEIAAHIPRNVWWARDRLWEANLIEVFKIVKTFLAPKGIQKESDLFMEFIEEGNVSLVESIRKHNPKRGSGLKTFIWWDIPLQLRKFWSAHSKVRVLKPGAVGDFRKASQEYDVLTFRNEGQKPTLEELASHLGWTETRTSMALEHDPDVVMFSTLSSCHTNHVDRCRAPNISDGERQIEIATRLYQSLCKIPQESSYVLQRKWGVGECSEACTYKELAREYGLKGTYGSTQKRIKNFVQAAMQEVRSLPNASELREFVA